MRVQAVRIPHIPDTHNSYNLRQKDVEVIDIGFLRAIAVTAGVLWAALVSRFWWPSEARRELSKSLSEFVAYLRSDIHDP